MDLETTRFQALLLRRREGKICTDVCSHYVKIATREFGRKSCIPEESASEFLLAVWENVSSREWPFTESTVDWIRYEAYALVHRIKQRMKYAKGKEADLSEEVLQHVLYDEPTHEPGPEPKTELTDLEQKIFRAAAHLSPLQHAVFYGTYRENKTIGDISVEIGKASQLVSKALDKAEHRICTILERTGVTWEDAKGVLNDMDRARI